VIGSVDRTRCMPASANFCSAASACAVKSTAKPPVPSGTVTADMQSVTRYTLLASAGSCAAISPSRSSIVLFTQWLAAWPAMTTANYHPNLGTPLYDQTAVVLGTVIAKAQELAQAGIAVRTVTLIITDGGDYGSTRCKPGDVKAIVADMLAQENHIVAAMGISDGTTDFRAVFRSMGIPDRWILTPGNSASEIRRAFAVFSQSAVRASQGAQLGGFSN